MNWSLLLLIGSIASSSSTATSPFLGAFAFPPTGSASASRSSPSPGDQGWCKVVQQPSFQTLTSTTTHPSSITMTTANRGHPTTTMDRRKTAAAAAAAAAAAKTITSTRRAAASSASAVTATALFMSNASGRTPTAAAAAAVIPGVGEEGCKLPSPSGVNMWPGPLQATMVVAIFVALGIGTALFDKLLSSRATYGHNGWLSAVLGAFYAFVGVTHFTAPKVYDNMYPPRGTWGGLWQVPGSKAFHVAWTGVAEVVGGVGLLFLGGVGDYYLGAGGAGRLASACALGLFALTWAVTPANIYMFTHGARTDTSADGEDIPLALHAVRFLMQVVLLGLLWQLGGGGASIVGSVAAV